ncbi:MAG TPA: Lrp/AsnC family transcriptional regulator [Ignisphaera sp.]|uniref:Lrp/AsnC family transcriptional regulator n=1 Tax=Ignisphaera aggregans TaxID=334771 RepID=A0A832YZ99_9CREN|nr:Lrp/AsnC family transcriptional regulator [Ignisphaera sp.]HIP57584.1 Lrp/AsnC family transcriptional regulator [Ignisphaera aggregans]
MAETLDELDYDILRILAKNCNKSAREIAKELNKSPTTIVLRLRKLRHLGIVRSCKAEIDYAKIGYDLIVILQLAVEYREVDKVVQTLRQMPQVRQVFVTVGTYNIFAIAMFRTLRELNSFILNTLSKFNVRDMSISIVAMVVKDEVNIEF